MNKIKKFSFQIFLGVFFVLIFFEYLKTGMISFKSANVTGNAAIGVLSLHFCCFATLFGSALGRCLLIKLKMKDSLPVNVTKLRYNLRTSTVALFYAVVFLAAIGILFGMWGVYLYFTGQGGGFAGSSFCVIVFSLGVTGLLFSSKVTPRAFELDGHVLSVLNADGTLGSYDLTSAVNYSKHPSYRELEFRQKKIRISNFYERHLEIFDRLDAIFSTEILRSNNGSTSE